MTYEELKAHVFDYFGDTSRPSSETNLDLETLAEECQILAESINSELD